MATVTRAALVVAGLAGALVGPRVLSLVAQGGKMKRTTVRAPRTGAQGEAGLYFRLLRGLDADELRVYVREQVLRWRIPAGLATAPGAKRMAYEAESLRAGGTHLPAPGWDEGFCRVEAHLGDPARAFGDGLAAGHLLLSFSGARLVGTYQLVRTHQNPGEQPQWLVWRSASLERVA